MGGLSVQFMHCPGRLALGLVDIFFVYTTHTDLLEMNRGTGLWVRWGGVGGVGSGVCGAGVGG